MAVRPKSLWVSSVEALPLPSPLDEPQMTCASPESGMTADVLVRRTDQQIGEAIVIKISSRQVGPGIDHPVEGSSSTESEPCTRVSTDPPPMAAAAAVQHTDLAWRR